MDVTVYRAADDVLYADLEAQAQERADLEKRIAAQPDRSAQRATLLEIAEAVDTFFARPPLEVNASLQRLGLQVFCEDGRIVEMRLA
jgi:hypothetical protein